jgi:type II secretory pathway pseudopilin PulG
MLRAAFGSLRLRLPLLVLIAVIPALGLVLYEAREQRQLAAAHALAEALQLARLAAQSYQHLLKAHANSLPGWPTCPLSRAETRMCAIPGSPAC